MNILLVYPKYPDTFWSFKHALKFIAKKAVHPPLGLLTVAAMLPEEWEQKLIDLNVAPLHDRDLAWADYVFLSAMVVQKESVQNIIARCQHVGVKIVAGGPLFTSEHENFPAVDHFVLNEAELTLPAFLEDVKKNQARPVYTADRFPDITDTPIPRWDLVKMKRYASMNIQYSRGCPFQCEFCDITVLYGHHVRTKRTDQIVAELESLYRQGWRGSVFFVDDNFIGNKSVLRDDVLPAIIDWMKRRKYPFTFSTEASINLADDDDLMRLMVQAGFDAVFVGIETPNEDSLAECAKIQNKHRDLIACVKKIQNIGLRVRGGFIVGFDHDTPSIFERQIEFIQQSGIITAMVGLLNAPRGTRLYKRVVRENRLMQDTSGDNTDCSTNFIPQMGYDTLLAGYKQIISGIYAPQPYYERVKTYLQDYRPLGKSIFHFHLGHLRFHFGYAGALFKSIVFLGIQDKDRIYFWKLFFWSLLRRPRLFAQAITYAIYGYHFRKVFENYL
ncbi:MAG: B12-binding domain-containing radical SAM protein [Candidatus Vecturithrix sp.]|jgi:radical SAM superfamily enzyme YgiQ (UPF0313 family)|nr:B12-binding domain-containing radical SAM protein [Candidatus Vecturithrix sp.]